MTNEQAKHKIDLLDFYLQNYTNDYGEESHTAMMMAIKALEQQTCEDAISREDALMALTGEWTESTDELIHRFIRRIRTLPSVKPQPKWIPVSERLPEDEQEILFSTKTGRVHSGKYHDDDSANQWYSHKDKCRAWNNVVIAWMPLPQPYEPQESEVSE